jgi:hypothetical protein
MTAFSPLVLVITTAAAMRGWGGRTTAMVVVVMAFAAGIGTIGASQVYQMSQYDLTRLVVHFQYEFRTLAIEVVIQSIRDPLQVPSIVLAIVIGMHHFAHGECFVAVVVICTKPVVVYHWIEQSIIIVVIVIAVIVIVIIIIIIHSSTSIVGNIIVVVITIIFTAQSVACNSGLWWRQLGFATMATAAPLFAAFSVFVLFRMGMFVPCGVRFVLFFFFFLLLLFMAQLVLTVRDWLQ